VQIAVIEEREPRHLDADSAYLHKSIPDLFTRFTLEEVFTQMSRIDATALDFNAKEVFYAVRQVFAEGVICAKEMQEAEAREAQEEALPKAYMTFN
jgi:hypothetical protein